MAKDTYQTQAQLYLRVQLDDLGYRFFSDSNMDIVHDDIINLVQQGLGVQLGKQSYTELFQVMLFVYSDPDGLQSAERTLIALNTRVVSMCARQLTRNVNSYVQYHQSRALGFQPPPREDYATRTSGLRGGALPTTLAPVIGDDDVLFSFTR